MLTTLLTPSYINDLERAVWMRKSIRRFQQEPYRHVIAVPSRDLAAFTKAFRGDASVDLFAQEDVVGKIFYPDALYRLLGRVAKSQLWRFEGHAGRAGWVVQQIVKLSCTRWVSEGAVAIIDSDLIFTRPFSAIDLGIDDTTRTLVRITPRDESSKHRVHVNNSRAILGLPPGSSDQHYMGYPTIWYVDWVRQLQQYLTAKAHADWQVPLHAAGHISEYTIYGIFVEEHLKPEKLALRTKPSHHIVFDSESFRHLKTRRDDLDFLRRNFLTLVVQSNLGLPVAEYEEVLDAIID